MQRLNGRSQGFLRTVSRTLTAAAALASAAIATAGQDQEPLGEAIVDIRSVGIEGIEPAPKDAGLYNALPRLGERITEVPVEVALSRGGDLEMAQTAARGFGVLWSAITGEAGLVVRPGVGPLGFGAALWTDPSGEMTPDRFRADVGELLEPFGIRVNDGPDGTAFATPFGPAPVETVDNESVIVSLGLNDPRPLEVQAFDLPRGVTPLISAHVNLREITAPLGPLLQAQDPAVRQQLIDSGAIGPDAAMINFAAGVDRERLHAVVRMIDAVALMTKSGVSPETVFTERDLRAFPRDTTIAVATPVSLSQLVQVRELIESAEGVDPLASFETMLNVDFNASVLENIGPRAMYYQSDTTGGGGVLSSVVIVELRDEEAFRETLERVTSALNDMAVAEIEGYARVIEREVGGHRAWTLAFPGLPVPLELSWTIEGGRFVAAASPLGLAAALDQLDDPDGRIGQASEFRRAAGNRMPAAGAAAVYFIDSTRFAPRGYGLMNLAVSGVANGLRNPKNHDAFVGEPLMPTYAEFIEGIEPFGAVATWDGGDYLFHMTTDRSLLVNGAVIASQQGLGLAQAGLIGGVLMPAFERARNSARQLKASTQLRGILQGGVVYSMEHRDQYPDSIEVLVEQGLVPREMLVSPFGPAWDGGPDYGWAGGEMMFDGSRVVAIDRAMYLNGEGVVVGFDDNHVEFMMVWELDEILDEPQNEGVRERLGID